MGGWGGEAAPPLIEKAKDESVRGLKAMWRWVRGRGEYNRQSSSQSRIILLLVCLGVAVLSLIVMMLKHLTSRMGVGSSSAVHGKNRLNGHAGLPPALVKAAFMCDRRVLAAGIKTIGDVDRKDARGRTLTMAAAEGGNPECVSMLLNAGARVDAMDSEGWTAVMAAAAGDHKATLKVLLKAGARVDAANDRGRTALMSVSYAGLDKIAKTLLEMGADPNIQDGDGWSAVRWAAKGNQGRTVHLLCRWGGDPNSKDFEGWHTLMAASLEGHREVVKALIEEGADVNSSDKEGNTALMTAAYGGNVDTVRDLIRSGASISALDKQGRSAADWAREGLAENQGGRKSRRDDFSSILDLVSVGRTRSRSGAQGLRRPSHI